MFTYGYIREATMAHLDIDESEAQAMNLLARFHIYANEAMQAICSAKPMYKYIDITVVEKFAPLVMDGAIFRPATDQEIKSNFEGLVVASDAQTKAYYHALSIYEINEKVSMTDTFITFENKQAWRLVKYKPTVAEQLEADAFGYKLKKGIIREQAKIDTDYSYISKNQLIFFKEGRYLIPGRFMWFRFDSGIGDDTELDMPSDILLTIPLYIAAICYQIDNPQKAQIMRSEFEMALARCTAIDFMTLNDLPSSW